MTSKGFPITKENLHLVIDDMPIGFYELATVVGEETALKLFSNRYGTHMLIGMNKSKAGKKLYEKLADEIGEYAASKFTEAFGKRGMRTFHFSSCTKARRKLRNIEIKKDFDDLTNSGISAHDTCTQIAIKYGMTSRSIWRILKT